MTLLPGILSGMSEWRPLPVSYGLSGRWQRTSPILYSVSARRPLRRQFMKASSALMHIIHNTKVTSPGPPVPFRTTAKDLHHRVARPSGNELFYGNTCRCCLLSANKSCRCCRDRPFKFPGTLIKSSPHPQYIPGIGPPTPTAMSLLTPFPDTMSMVLPALGFL